MAQDDVMTDSEEVLEDDDLEPEIDEEDEFLEEEQLEDVLEDEAIDDESAESVEGEVEAETETETEALEELEAEELELLDEEAAEALLVDEVAELRAIRREELTMNVDAQQAQTDEFVCASCFLVKRTSQLANRRKMTCTDCAT